jgi:HSP20 family protein
MTETEVKAAKSPAKRSETSPEWTALDFPFFRGDLFDFPFLRGFSSEAGRFLNTAPKTSGLWVPAIEVGEKDGNFVITADLPGMNQEDIKVHTSGDAVILEGERKSSTEEKEAGYYHRERSFGRFYRSIPLPNGAELEKAYAEYLDGVLKVMVPAPAFKPKTREIPVNTA